MTFKILTTIKGQPPARPATILQALAQLTGANWPIFENWLAYCLFPMCLLFRSIWFLHFESPALTSREFFGAETPTSFENNSNEICNKLFTDSYHPPLFSQLIMWKLWFHWRARGASLLSAHTRHVTYKEIYKLSVYKVRQKKTAWDSMFHPQPFQLPRGSKYIPKYDLHFK